MRISPTGLLRRLPGRSVFLVLLMFGVSGNAIAGKWTVTPDITVRGTYTDNASLLAVPTEGDFVTQVAPGIHIAGRGGRFKGNLDYTANAIFYGRNSAQDRIANSLNAMGTLEAIENFFYVDAYGNISQTFISPFAPQPSDVSSISSNRAEARTYGISPYVRGRVGNAFSYQLRYRYAASSSNSSALPGLYTTDWTGHAASPIRVFGWALDYDNNTINYTDYNSYAPPRLYSKLYRGTLYFQPDPRLLLSASGGQEENNYSLEKASNSIYGGGVSWKPTPITSADFNWEHRFYGPSRHASLKHRTRLTAWTLTYSRDTTNYQRALLTLPPGNVAALLDAIFTASIPDPAARQAAVAQFLQATGIPAFLSNPISFYTQQVFLQEHLDASVAILGKRSSVLFSVFRAKTQALTGNFNSAAPDAFTLAQGSAITQSGFGVSANHKLTASTSLGASATRTYARQDVPTTVKSRNDYFTLHLDRTLSPKTTAFAGLAYSHYYTSAAAASSSSNARSAFIGLTHRF